MIDFSDRKDSTLGGEITILRATREPCPACGHPTGDCPGTHPAPAPQDTLGANIFRSLDGSQTFLVKENIYDEVEMTTGITMRILVVPAGKQIPMRRARELGLI